MGAPLRRRFGLVPPLNPYEMSELARLACAPNQTGCYHLRPSFVAQS
jgi:hypothetical protein